MIDRFLYLVSEGFRSLWRTKTTALATISAIGIATSFVVFTALVGENLSSIINLARGQYEFQIFFNDDIDNLQATQITGEIADLEGIRAVSLIKKEDAAEIFKREFGEDIFDLLNYNPLPTGCVVNLNEPTEGRLYIDPIIKEIKSIKNQTLKKRLKSCKVLPNGPKRDPTGSQNSAKNATLAEHTYIYIYICFFFGRFWMPC